MRYPFKQKKSKPSNDTGLKAGALENDLAHSSPGLKAQGFSEQDYKIT